MTERVDYVVDEGVYIASPVNLSMVVVQANSLEEMKSETKKMMQAIITEFQKIIDTNSLEFNQVKKLI